MRFTQQFRGGKSRVEHIKKKRIRPTNQGEIAISNRKHLIYFICKQKQGHLTVSNPRNTKNGNVKKRLAVAQQRTRTSSLQPKTVAFGGKLQAMDGLIRAIGLVEQWLFRLQIPEMDHLSGRRYGVTALSGGSLGF